MNTLNFIKHLNINYFIVDANSINTIFQSDDFNSDILLGMLQYLMKLTSKP